MKIENLILYNYRLYKGLNEFKFNNQLKTPISLVSGLNGFGKTSFVHALAWCLYGNLIVQVDENYRKEIFSNGGYKKFLLSQMNRTADLNKVTDNYYVKVVLDGVQLPGTIGSQVSIERKFNMSSMKESLRIEIDGMKNQLTEELGYEEFINDYILPREIAKFFFFDSEKIVDLADIEREDNKRTLYSAYSKVLGLSSYLDLKTTLQNLIKRVSKEGLESDGLSEMKAIDVEIDTLQTEKSELAIYSSAITKEVELIKQKQLVYQSQIRKAGISLTGDNVENIALEIDLIRNQITEKRQLLNNYLTYLPFLIVSDLLKRLSKESETLNLNSETKIIERTKAQILLRIKELQLLPANKLRELKNEIDKTVGSTIQSKTAHDKARTIEELTLNKLNQLMLELDLSVKNNLIQTVSEIKNLTRLERNKKSQISEYDKYIKSDSAENKVVTFEELQSNLEIKITELERIRIRTEVIQKTLDKLFKRKQEILDRAVHEKRNAEKVELAKKLIGDIDTYLDHLKQERKNTLEKTILTTVNSLSHKKWITKVVVDFGKNILDVSLFGADGLLIDKGKLSKGEQQMYASAVLVSLISESSIDFPVIMDSPLQKLDKHHAKNFITNLYPLLGSQIILLPLLDKELREDEYALMFNTVSDSYLIVNSKGNSMVLNSPKEELFTNFRNSMAHG